MPPNDDTTSLRTPTIISDLPIKDVDDINSICVTETSVCTRCTADERSCSAWGSDHSQSGLKHLLIETEDNKNEFIPNHSKTENEEVAKHFMKHDFSGVTSCNTAPFISKTQTYESCSSKKVRFSRVEFREYDMILGDNPSCSHGPPVSLGWCCFNTFSISLEITEHYDTKQHRCLKEMVLPRHVRERILLDQNFSRSDQRRVIVENQVIKDKRKRSAKRSQRIWLDQIIEYLKRTMKNWTCSQIPENG